MNNKYRLCLIIVYIVFVNGMVWGQASPFTWPNWFCSDTWETMSKEAKFGCILGLLHGEIAGAMDLSKTLRESKLFDENSFSLIWKKNAENSTFFKSLKVSYEQMIEGIDKFYQDYANKDIPVYLLLPLVCKRVKGEISPEAIEQELQNLRVESLKWKN